MRMHYRNDENPSWRRTSFVAALPMLLTLLAIQPALAQIGFVSSVSNSLTELAEGGESSPRSVGNYIDRAPTTLVTGPDSQAMLFFVGGLAGAEVEFKGAIVVLMYEDTRIIIDQGFGAMRPFEFKVEQGRAKVHFDARDHRDHVRVSTPLAKMEVTGSVLWAMHDPIGGLSLFASEDSNAVVSADLPAAGDTRNLLSGQKLSADKDGLGQPQMLTPDDLAAWQLSDLPLLSALTQRPAVREDRSARAYAWLEVRAEGAVVKKIERERVEPRRNVPNQVAVTQTQVTSTLQLAATQRVNEFGSSFGQGRLGGGFGSGGAGSITASRSGKLPAPPRGGG